MCALSCLILICAPQIVEARSFDDGLGTYSPGFGCTLQSSMQFAVINQKLKAASTATLASSIHEAQASYFANRAGKGKYRDEVELSASWQKALKTAAHDAHLDISFPAGPCEGHRNRT